LNNAPWPTAAKKSEEDELKGMPAAPITSNGLTGVWLKKTDGADSDSTVSPETPAGEKMAVAKLMLVPAGISSGGRRLKPDATPTTTSAA
jgi:hypothetical protein